MGGKHIPAEKINLKLILVSGRTKEYLFSPNDSAGDIAQFVFDHWPPDWADESGEPNDGGIDACRVPTGPLAHSFPSSWESG